MKDKNIITIVIVGIVAFLIFQQYLIFNKSPDNVDDNILKELKTLNKKLDDLSNKKDSVKTIILQLDNDLEKNNKRHEEVVDGIINADDSTNRVFIDNYIKQYIERISEK